MPMGMPGWPELAFSTASMASARIAFAISLWVTGAFGATFILCSLNSSSRAFDELHDDRGEDELHGKIELAAGDDDRIRPRHETVVNHREQVREVDPARILEADDHHGFVRCRNPACRERIGGIDRRHALEIDVGLGE